MNTTMTYRVLARSLKGTCYRFRVTLKDPAQMSTVIRKLRETGNYRSLNANLIGAA